jgi:hypothetical protein
MAPDRSEGQYEVDWQACNSAGNPDDWGSDVRRRDHRVGWWIPANGEPTRIVDMSDVHLDHVLRYLDRTGNERSAKRLEVATEIDRRKLTKSKIDAGEIEGIDRERADAVIERLGFSRLSLVAVGARRVLLAEFAAARRDERQRAIDSRTRDLEETLRRLPEVLHTLMPSISLVDAKSVIDNVRATVEHHNEDRSSE